MIHNETEEEWHRRERRRVLTGTSRHWVGKIGGLKPKGRPGEGSALNWL